MENLNDTVRKVCNKESELSSFTPTNFSKEELRILQSVNIREREKDHSKENKKSGENITYPHLLSEEEMNSLFDVNQGNLYNSNDSLNEWRNSHIIHPDGSEEI